jgi:hypothetical protein
MLQIVVGKNMSCISDWVLDWFLDHLIIDRNFFKLLATDSESQYNQENSRLYSTSHWTYNK